MSDETRMTAAGTADDPSTAEKSEPQAVAEAETPAREARPPQGARNASAPNPAGAPGPDRTGRGKPQQAALSRVEGPAIFNRAKQGNQRRNPRHVGNDVRIDDRRKTRVTAKMQRKVTRAIKRARHLALMPYTGEHIRITGRRS